jgi:CRISPR/Cas system-associated protein Cas10 (large subunit of type III CRISPR-Cas system)
MSFKRITEKERKIQIALGILIDWENYYPSEELCPVCKQPDSCGDCNHHIMTREESQDLLP